MRGFWRCIPLLAGLVSGATQAQTEVAVPSALQDWRGWALQEQQFRTCPMVAGSAGAGASDFVCAWPGTLRFDAGAEGAQFALRWRVDAPSWVPLPGDEEHWPQQVTANGLSVPVLERRSAPVLRLAPGTYEIAGRIPWTQRPQALTVPVLIGVVALSVDGQTIAPVQRDGDELTLGRGSAQAPEADALDVRVYRRLADGLPATLETVIELAASGQAREETLGPVLPEGFVPTALESDWPARLDPDGRLRVQVQPDTTELLLRARALEPLNAASARLPAAPWPRQEIWSYASAPLQRVTNAGGATQVDPVQAGVPDDWRDLPAFAMEEGSTLTLEQRSRGQAADEGNRLTLERQAWLDFSGAGWTLRDRVQGVMHRDWRLDVVAPYRLERAQSLVEGAPLLVTALDGVSGVEWRSDRVDLDAGLRADAGGALPIAGWKQSFDAVNATVHLPYGYRLFAAPGADAAHGSWLSSWTLLDVFIAAVITLLAWRGLGLAGGALAGVYLLLAYHEPDAPLWSLGLALALGLIERALPEGKLRRFGAFCRRAALLVLVLVTVPFVAAQLRMALYPQLEGAGLPWSDDEVVQVSFTEPPAAPAAMAPRVRQQPMPAEAVADAASELERIEVTGARIKRSALLERYSQTTIVQTGRGMPAWQGGRSHQLSWSGPVLAEQSVRLWISPPWLTRALRVIVVALLALLGLHLFGRALPRWRPGRAATASVLFAGALAVMPSLPAQAQTTPDPALLEELRARLGKAPDCAPTCAALAVAQVHADGDRLRVALEVHAAAKVAVPLPNDARALTLSATNVDGAPAIGIAQVGGSWRLPLERGVHRIELDFRVDSDKVALAFPLAPARVRFVGAGWQASGLSEERLLTETLTLARVRASSEAGRAPVAVQEFPPYVRLKRRLSLGLDWSVYSSAERMAPEEGGFSLSLPLLPGERVLTSGLTARAGRIELPIPDGASQAQWSGALDKADAITLTAPPLAEHAEVWEIVVSPLWRASFAGVPESTPDPDYTDAEDWHQFTFHPLPGETLTLAVARPAAAAGSTLAIDDADLTSQVGQRASEHTLALRLRASQGGEHVITLPADAEVLAVSRDGEALNLRPREGKLSLPLRPGEQRFEIRFRTPEGASWRNRTPEVALGLPAANIDLTLSLPDDRWVLLTRGPRVGPAVLYWGELLVLILVAWGLARSGYTPLKLHAWLLLGIGFSTFSWVALAIVVVWLFALAWRERQGAALSTGWFDLTQLVLVGLSLAALIALVTAIPYGLLGAPDMHVVGNGSYAQQLRWFADQSEDALPRAGAFTLPLWLYRGAMLLWALWLANAVLGWLRWAFRAWTAGGYWRRLRKAPPTPSA